MELCLRQNQLPKVLSTELRSYIPLEKKKVILGMFFPANLLA